MGELTNRVKTVRIEAERAVQIMLDAAEIIDNANVSALHDALSETIKQRDELRVHNVNQRETLSKLDKELDQKNAVIQSLQEHVCLLENTESKKIQALEIQIVNLQEFNDKQRQQLESLQKEMAAIHMCVVATSRSKLDDAMAQYCKRGDEPFLLKAVYAAMSKSFDSKYAAERCASRIRAARHELES